MRCCLLGTNISTHSCCCLKDTDVTLAVGLGNFLAADDSPWELLMATGVIYAMPPAAIYYAFKRYMVGGLTEGAVKS
jgi:multiple sugar transport system permease protein